MCLWNQQSVTHSRVAIHSLVSQVDSVLKVRLPGTFAWLAVGLTEYLTQHHLNKRPTLELIGKWTALVGLEYKFPGPPGLAECFFVLFLQHYWYGNFDTRLDNNLQSEG